MLAPAPSKNITDCPTCDGYGAAERGDGTECARCAGEGFLWRCDCGGLRCPGKRCECERDQEVEQ
jgi:hypothetical protein